VYAFPGLKISTGNRECICDLKKENICIHWLMEVGKMYTKGNLDEFKYDIHDALQELL
jgi:hypothetical protein